MKRFVEVFLAVVLLAGIPVAQARQKLQGWCQRGGQVVTTTGNPSNTSTNKVQQSYPNCTVTVYDTGTLNLSTIYSDNAGTAKANPFTANSTGEWYFYADNARYDIKYSGGGITTPFTLTDFVLSDPATAAAIPAGANTQVQFNDAGAMAGDAGMTYNKTTNTLSVDAVTATTLTATTVNGAMQDNGGAVINVKHPTYGAVGNGVTDDTVAIRAALAAGAGKVVYFPPGTYKVTDVGGLGYGLACATGTTIKGGGSNQSVGDVNTKIMFATANVPLFLVRNNNCRISDMWLAMDATVTPLAGNVAVKVQNNGVAPYLAETFTLENVAVGGATMAFYDGIDIDGTQTSIVRNVLVSKSLRYGFVTRAAQGFWSDLKSLYNYSHGFYMTGSAIGATTVYPTLNVIETYANGGWGIYCDSGAPTYLAGYYLNNDSLGELYINSTTSNGGLIEKGIIQLAGNNPSSVTKAVSAATVATPIELTFTTNHGWVTGTSITCAGIAGNLAANGTFTITEVLGQPTKLTLDTSVGTTAYTAGGVCGLTSQNYPISPTAPGVKIAAGVTNTQIDGMLIDSTYGNGIDAAGQGLRLSNTVIGTAGEGGVVGSRYCLKSTGAGSQITGVVASCGSYVSGNLNVITGSMFGTANSDHGLTIPSGTDGTLTGNRMITSSTGDALHIDTGTTLAPGSNQITGAYTDNSKLTSTGAWTGIKNTYAVISVGQTAFGYCTDCQLTSATNNECKAGGTGAWFFYDYGVTAFRCFADTVSTVTGGEVLGGANAAERVRIDEWGLIPPTKAFADLGTPANGHIVYCSDCTIASPCAGGGSGAIAKRLGAAWVCN